jgi:hypothetical protein
MSIQTILAKFRHASVDDAMFQFDSFQGYCGNRPTNELEFNSLVGRVVFNPDTNQDETLPVFATAVTWEQVQEKLTVLKLADLRKVRDMLLAETDWWAVADRTMTPEQSAYRQALRDITDTYTSLDDVVWPVKPE